MTWYQRINFKLIIVIIILLLAQDCITFAQCANTKSIPFLKEISHNNIVFKCSPNIKDVEAKLSFDEGLNYLIKNPKTKLNFCRYLNVTGNLLNNFERSSPYYHINCYLGQFKNYHINLQLTHKKLKNFIEFSDTDIYRDFRPQYVGNHAYIYNNYEQVFLNLNSLHKNKSLESFNNYKLFLPDVEKSKKIEEYLLKFEDNLLNQFSDNFGLKNKK